MIVARSLDAIARDVNSVVTVGTFDGVHRAHQEILREVINRARMSEGRSVVVTFEPHPKEIVGKLNQPVRLLATSEERVELIRKANIDLLFIINFTQEFSHLTAREFYQRYVVHGIGVNEVVVGYDHMFGHNRTAGIEELVRIGKEFNFSVSAVHPYRVDGEVVSSTQVRNALIAGDVEKAANMLGYLFSLAGMIVRGDGRGKTLGYPTANVQPSSDKKLIPGRGVYLAGVQLRGKQWFGMTNIGVRPTVKSSGEISIETHIFDLNEDVYGEPIVVTFLRKLRNEQKFDSLEHLMQQLSRDKETSMKFLADVKNDNNNPSTMIQ